MPPTAPLSRLLCLTCARGGAAEAAGEEEADEVDDISKDDIRAALGVQLDEDKAMRALQRRMSRCPKQVVR